jgi:hypothetical protein
VRELRKLEVQSAFYGLGEGQYQDVTTTVRGLVVDDALNFKVCNDAVVGGRRNDPFPGQRKHLTVVYSIGGRTMPSMTIGERGWVRIPSVT